MMVGDGIVFPLATAITRTTPPTEIDQVARSMVYLFESHRMLLAILEIVIKDEIAKNKEENTLFR